MRIRRYKYMHYVAYPRSSMQAELLADYGGREAGLSRAAIWDLRRRPAPSWKSTE